MKIAIYSRKSKFTGKGESVENQVQLCREYIDRSINPPGDTRIDVYEDEGFSGKNMSRPQFQAMMKKTRAKYYDYIICYRLDRISRNVSDFSSLIEELHQYKTSFVCIREQFDTSTPMGRAMMYIASVFAQLERETIAERIRDNMMLLARTGRWLGGNTPLGYGSQEVLKDTTDGKVRTSFKLIPIPDEIELVQFIFERYLKDRSMAKVEALLINQGIRTRQGKYFTSVAIREILSNPVYCIADQPAYGFFEANGCDICIGREKFDGRYGIAAYNRTSHSRERQDKNDPAEWIISIGKHKGIVEGKDWGAVQEALRSNRHGTVHKRVHNPVALLSGLLVCKNCSSFMRPRVNSNKARNEAGEQTFSYLCELKKRSKGQQCDCANLCGNDLDRAVCETVLDLCREGGGISEKILKLKDAELQKRKVAIQSTATLRNRIIECQNKISNLIDILSKDSNNTILYAYTEKEIADIDAQITSLRQQLEEQEKEEKQGQIACKNVEFLESVVRSLCSTFYQASVPVKRGFLSALIDRVEWDGKDQQVHIFLLGKQFEN